MKKVLTALVVTVVMMAVMGTGALAKVVESGEYGENATWSFDDNGTFTVSGKGETTDFYSVWGRPYRMYASEIEKVVVEEGITSIGDNAFYNYGNIKFVSLPSTLERIGESAFEGCNDIEKIVIPDSVKTIDKSAFESCSNLSEIIISNNVSFIGRWAFDGTAYYKDEANWENDLLYVGNYLVKAVDRISGEITVRDGTVGLADNLFFGSDNITKISLPASLRYLSDDPFDSARYGLKAFSVSLDSKYFSTDNHGVLYSKDKTVLYSYPLAAGLESYTIPDTVKVVEDYAFYLASSLKTITMGCNIEKIGYYSFSACSGIKEISIHDSLKLIEEDAFDSCRNLTNIYFEGSKEQWYECLLNNYTEEEKAKDNFELDESDFYNDYEVTVHFDSVIDGKTTPKIAKFKRPMNNWQIEASEEQDITLTNTSSEYTYVFTLLNTKTNEYLYNKVPISAVGMVLAPNTLDPSSEYKLWVGTLSNGQTVGSGDIIYITTNEKEFEQEFPQEPVVVSPDAVPKNIDTEIFSQLGRDYLNIRLDYGAPTKVASYLGGAAYYFNNEKVVLAFGTQLTGYGVDMIIYNNEESFEEPFPFEKALRGASFVKEIITNLSKDSYTTNELSSHIGILIKTEYSEFLDSYLHSFNYNGIRVDIENESQNTISVDDFCDIYPFSTNEDAEIYNYHDMLGSEITTPGGVDSFPKQGVFTYKAGTIYKVDPSASGEIIIPNSIGGTVITDISGEAFDGCDKITRIVLPGNVTVINNNTFKNMTCLESIVLPINLRFIGKNAFEGCTSLKEIDIPFKTVNIAENAFRNCTGLVTAKIPPSVSRIGSNVFYGCTSLENLLFEAEITSHGSKNFVNCTSLKNVIFGSQYTKIGYLSSQGVLGGQFTRGEADIKNMMILSNVKGKHISTSGTLISYAENVYYPYEYVSSFDGVQNGNVRTQFDPYDFPVLYEFLDNYDNVIITMNEKLIFPNVAPVNDNGRVLAPVRDLLEHFGMFVDWDASTKTVIAKGDRTEILLPIGSKTAYVNGNLLELDAPAKIINGSTMVPVRFITEILGGTADWEQSQRRVIITYKALRNPTINPTDLASVSYIKLSDYGLIKNISVKDLGNEHKVEFDYYNYLNIPMQIMVYNRENMIVDSFVTDAVWTELNFTNALEDTKKGYDYLYDVMVVGNSNDEDYVAPYSYVALTEFKDEKCIKIPKDGYISIMFPKKGTDAYYIMNVIKILRSDYMVMELSSAIVENPTFEGTTLTVNGMLDNISWNDLIKSEFYEDIKQIVDGMDQTYYDKMLNPASMDEFFDGLYGVFNVEDGVKILTYCLCDLKTGEVLNASVMNGVNEILGEGVAWLAPGFDKLADIVNACKSLSQIEVIHGYEQIVDDMTYAETIRFIP